MARIKGIGDAKARPVSAEEKAERLAKVQEAKAKRAGELDSILPKLAKYKPFPAADHRRHMAGLLAYSLTLIVDGPEQGEMPRRTLDVQKLQHMALWPVIDALWQFSGFDRTDPRALDDSVKSYWSNLRQVYGFANYLEGYSSSADPFHKYIHRNELWRAMVNVLGNGMGVMHLLPWYHREAVSLQSGTHKRVAWYQHERLKPVPNHFAHLSPKEATSIRFIEDSPSGHRKASMSPPVYTLMRGGKYLARFYPELSDAQRQDLATMLDADATFLQFAKSADDIRRVYTKSGIPSCMTHSKSKWGNLPCHPVDIYGDSDLQLAYLLHGGRTWKARPDDTARVIARALVWPERKVYCRVYGDGNRMHAALKKEGYQVTSEHANGFTGARIRAVKWDGFGEAHQRYVFPYVDWHDCATLEKNGDWFRLGRHKGDEFGAAVNCQPQTGYLYLTSVDCSICQRTAARATVTAFGRVCPHCIQDRAAYQDWGSMTSPGAWVRESTHGRAVEVVTSIRAFEVGSQGAWLDAGGRRTWSTQTAQAARAFLCGMLGYWVSRGCSDPVMVTTMRGMTWREEQWARQCAEVYARQVDGTWVHRDYVDSWRNHGAALASLQQAAGTQ